MKRNHNTTSLNNNNKTTSCPCFCFMSLVHLFLKFSAFLFVSAKVGLRINTWITIDHLFTVPASRDQCRTRPGPTRSCKKKLKFSCYCTFFSLSLFFGPLASLHHERLTCSPCRKIIPSSRHVRIMSERDRVWIDLILLNFRPHQQQWSRDDDEAPNYPVRCASVVFRNEPLSSSRMGYQYLFCAAQYTVFRRGTT